MTDWTIFIDGVHQTGTQKIKVLDTIAGSKKCEFILNDVSKMNDINHFADVEVWVPTDNPPGGLVFDGSGDHSSSCVFYGNAFSVGPYIGP